MKVVCAWCENEGHPSLLAVWPPTDDCRVSHGICESHAASYRKSLSSGEKAPITTKLRDVLLSVPTPSMKCEDIATTASSKIGWMRSGRF